MPKPGLSKEDISLIVYLFINNVTMLFVEMFCVWAEMVITAKPSYRLSPLLSTKSHKTVVIPEDEINGVIK